MLTFYSPSSLTEDQKARWDYAMQEYERVMERNNQRGVNAGYPGPGSPKSALFARLLSGKPALETPPPKACSYPWYAIIEDERAQSVMVEGPGRIEADNGHPLEIRLFQCPWEVQFMNDAARQLIELDERVRANTRLSHKAPAMLGVRRSELEAIYEGKPEFLVRHGENPVYRLFTERHNTVFRRIFAERCQEDRRQGKFIDGVRSVFDSAGALLGFDGEFTRVDKVEDVDRLTAISYISWSLERVQ